MRSLHISIFILLLLCVSPAFGQDGLVGYWNFDKQSGDTLFDQSTYGNHGTNFGGQFIDGVQGKALLFDGFGAQARISGDSLTPPDILSELGQGTISIWFNVFHIPPEDGIAPIFYYGAEEKCDFFDAANQGLIIEVGHSPIHYKSESIYFTIWKNGCTYPSFCFDSKNAVPTGEWHHFAVVVGEDFNTGYMNGSEMTNRRYNFGTASYSQFFEDAVKHERLWLGMGYWDRTIQHLDGAIDELRIYDRPLSSGEVKALYQNTPSSVQSLDKANSPIKVYPVPALDNLHYETRDKNIKIRSVRISDLMGKLIYSEKQQSDKRNLSVESLSRGVYFIDFIGEKGIYRKKITVE